MTRNHPKRLTPPAPFGSMLKCIGDVPQRRAPKAEPDEDPDHLALIRQLPCLYCGYEPSEAAHVRIASAAFGKASGLGKKPADRWAVPLCAQCHRLGKHAQHNRGEAAFWQGIGINPLIVATQLYARRGDAVAMRHIVIVAIANRDRKSTLIERQST